MKLPRFTAKTPPPRISGAARATDIGSLTQTGEGAKLRGIGAIGGALAQVSGLLFKAHQDRQAIDAGIQHDKATATMNSAHNTNFAEASKLPVMSPAERKKFMADYGKDYDKLSALTLKGMDNIKGREMFRKTSIGQKSRQMTALYGALTATLDEQQKLDKDTTWQAQLLNASAENIEEVKKAVAEDIRRHLPLFGATGVRSRIANLNNLTSDVRKDSYKNSIYNGESNLEILREEIQKDPSIGGDLREELLDDVGKEQNRRDQIAQEEFEAVQKETHRGLLLSLWDKTLKPGQIEEAVKDDRLTTEDGVRLRDEFLAGREPELDWNKYYKVLSAVNDIKKGLITEQDALKILTVNADGIDSVSGKSLVASISSAAQAYHDEKHPLKRNDVQRGLTTLEELKDIRIQMFKTAMKDDPTITDQTLTEELLNQARMKNDFEQWVQEKDRTTEEIEKKVKAITSPIATDVVLNWFERLMWTKRPQVFGFVGTQEERLATKIREAQEGGLPQLVGFGMTELETEISNMSDEELDAELRKLK